MGEGWAAGGSSMVLLLTMLKAGLDACSSRDVPLLVS